MTKAEIASHVCEVVGTTDDESIALCKKFIQRRYELIWDSHPWRETLDVCTATVLSGYRNAVFTGSPDIERILVAVESDRLDLAPVEWANLWAFDPAAFTANGGASQGFSICRRTPLIVGQDRALSLATATANSSTVDVTVTAKGRDTNGNAQAVFCTIAAGSGNSGTFATQASNPYYELALTEVWSVETSVSTWTDSAATIDLKTAVGGTTLGVLSDGKTVHPTFAQIRLTRQTTAQTNLRALGKLRANILDDDDAPRIDNIAEPLIGLVQADMLERQRQYSKAQAKRGEAGALVAGLLVDLQRRQSADGMQIIPDMEPYSLGMAGQKGYW